MTGGDSFFFPILFYYTKIFGENATIAERLINISGSLSQKITSIELSKRRLAKIRNFKLNVSVVQNKLLKF